MAEVMNTDYYINDASIDIEYHFFNKKKKTIQYKNITDIASVQSVFERIFDLGTINISTA